MYSQIIDYYRLFTQKDRIRRVFGRIFGLDRLFKYFFLKNNRFTDSPNFRLSSINKIISFF
jgi:hypothetical protein